MIRTKPQSYQQGKTQLWRGFIAVLEIRLKESLKEKFN